MNQTKIKAEIVGHSLSPQGDELISVLCTFPRIILAEVNTHRMLSKNTSSSRAIPFNKMVESVQNDPFIPIAWQKHHSGMQGNEYIIDEGQIRLCNNNWLNARDNAVSNAHLLSIKGATKQLCNRLLEPFMWTTMLITSSKEGWENFFSLRCPSYTFHNDINYHFKSKKDVIAFGKSVGDTKIEYPDGIEVEMEDLAELDWMKLNLGQAEIHMMALAEAIWDSVNESTPRQLHSGQWHIPFEDKICDFNITLSNEELVKISTAMAAHTSYTIVGGEAVKSYEKWIELHDKLIASEPPHSSPLEHTAQVPTQYEYDMALKGEEKGWFYNLKGFKSYRYIIETKKYGDI